MGGTGTSQWSPAHVAHLGMLQNAIERMGRNAFLLKGWAATLVAGLMTVAITSHEPAVTVVGVLPVLALGRLDAYYLSLERRFRARFEQARAGPGAAPTFEMTPGPPLSPADTWLCALTSPSVAIFYLSLALVAALLGIVLLEVHL